eukprot:TRINITY_DN418_c0_g1::TRINITY_DN418_c0_g1_i1::g.2459::m.2459 TRINITY_DN418_c0_g1::TRINITY_DN418_c0_g1_i1::g.2459  ORF type:complete len:147 (+),score=17.97,IPP-2/PF04979.9/5e+02,IPP-2/PF04979.9/3.7e-06 TRINITY_DN418_c0_g1_i1:3-443(+)
MGSKKKGKESEKTQQQMQQMELEHEHHQKRRGSVHFNESNLRENEEMKRAGEYGTMKIDEPKTPFQAYEPPSDTDEDMNSEPRSPRSCEDPMDAEHRLKALQDVEDWDEVHQLKPSHDEFESKRKENYQNMGALLKRSITDDDEES